MLCLVSGIGCKVHESIRQEEGQYERRWWQNFAEVVTGKEEASAGERCADTGSYPLEIHTLLLGVVGLFKGILLIFSCRGQDGQGLTVVWFHGNTQV
eukprot:s2828_g2.t1